MKDLAKFEQDLDVEVRLEEPSSSDLKNELTQRANSFVELFWEYVEIRFPQGDMNIAEAFSTFDPQALPSSEGMDEKQKQEHVLKLKETFVKAPPKKLLEHYGTHKTKKDGANVPPVIDLELANQQWITWRERFFNWVFKLNLVSFRAIARKAYVAARNPVFAS